MGLRGWSTEDAGKSSGCHIKSNTSLAFLKTEIMKSVWPSYISVKSFLPHSCRRQEVDMYWWWWGSPNSPFNPLVLNWGQFCPPRDMCPCLEAFLVVTNGIQWAKARDAAKHSPSTPGQLSATTEFSIDNLLVCRLLRRPQHPSPP